MGHTKEFDAHVIKFIGLFSELSSRFVYLYTYTRNILKTKVQSTELAWIMNTKTLVSHIAGNVPLRVQPRLELGYLWWCT